MRTLKRAIGRKDHPTKNYHCSRDTPASRAEGIVHLPAARVSRVHIPNDHHDPMPQAPRTGRARVYCRRLSQSRFRRSRRLGRAGSYPWGGGLRQTYSPTINLFVNTSISWVWWMGLGTLGACPNDQRWGVHPPADLLPGGDGDTEHMDQVDEPPAITTISIPRLTPRYFNEKEQFPHTTSEYFIPNKKTNAAFDSLFFQARGIGIQITIRPTHSLDEDGSENRWRRLRDPHDSAAKPWFVAVIPKGQGFSYSPQPSQLDLKRFFFFKIELDIPDGVFFSLCHDRHRWFHRSTSENL